MGRSVSVASGATSVVYIVIDCEDADDFDGLLDCLRGDLVDVFPSFEDCDFWVDREDLAILENGHARVVVSEYLGLVSVCLVPNEDPLARAWCDQVADTFRTALEGWDTVALIGYASNGEGFYRRKS